MFWSVSRKEYDFIQITSRSLSSVLASVVRSSDWVFHSHSTVHSSQSRMAKKKRRRAEKGKKVQKHLFPSNFIYELFIFSLFRRIFFSRSWVAIAAPSRPSTDSIARVTYLFLLPFLWLTIHDYHLMLWYFSISFLYIWLFVSFRRCPIASA